MISDHRQGKAGMETGAFGLVSYRKAIRGVCVLITV